MRPFCDSHLAMHGEGLVFTGDNERWDLTFMALYVEWIPSDGWSDDASACIHL